MKGNMIIFLFGIALFLSALTIRNCLAKKHDSPELKELKDIEAEFNCQGLRGKTPMETSILLTKCSAIMSSGIMRSTKEYLMKSTKEERANARLEFRKKGRRGLSRKRRSTDDCPVMNEEYLRINSEMTGLRSLSPYKSELDYNSSRFPKYIVQNYCLCDGCIDPTTSRETHNYVSTLITATSGVFYRNSEDKGPPKYTSATESINVGCTCIKPTIV